jgi:hypothetical protein
VTDYTLQGEGGRSHTVGCAFEFPQGSMVAVMALLLEAVQDGDKWWMVVSVESRMRIGRLYFRCLIFVPSSCVVVDFVGCFEHEQHLEEDAKLSLDSVK